MRIYLSIAAFVIEVVIDETEYPKLQKKLIADIHKEYLGFIIQKPIEKPSFRITIEDRQKLMTIVRTHTTCIEFYSIDVKNRVVRAPFSISVFHLSLILREVASILLCSTKTGLFFHCSAIEKGGSAILFTGLSGSGKSTISQLLASTFQILSDDIGIIKKENNHYYYYQSPTVEKNPHIVKSYKRYVIRSINFLKRSQNTKQERINDKGTILHLLSHQIVMTDNNVDNVDIQNYAMRWIMSLLAKKSFFYYIFFSKNRGSVVSHFKNGIIDTD